MERGRSLRMLEAKGRVRSSSAMFLRFGWSAPSRTFYPIGFHCANNPCSCTIPIPPLLFHHAHCVTKRVWIFVVRAFPSFTFALSYDSRQPEPSCCPLRCHVSYVPLPAPSLEFTSCSCSRTPIDRPTPSKLTLELIPSFPPGRSGC